MSRYEVVPATIDLAIQVAWHMREPDVQELWSGFRVTPFMAVEKSMEVSRDTMVGLVDGCPVTIAGIATLTVLSTRGCPWLLSTSEVDDRRHSVALMLRSKRYLAWASRGFDALENYVDARNNRAIQWLRWLNFDIDPAKPFGYDGLPFHRFHMEC